MDKITGRVLLEDGQVFEVEFDSIENGVQSDYILWRETRQQYDFYYNDVRLYRLADDDFVDDIQSLKNQITMKKGFRD